MATISANKLAKELDLPIEDMNALIKKLPATVTGRRKVGDSFVVDRKGFDNAFDGLTASQMALAPIKSKAGKQAAATRAKKKPKAANNKQQQFNQVVEEFISLEEIYSGTYENIFVVFNNSPQLKSDHIFEFYQKVLTIYLL